MRNLSVKSILIIPYMYIYGFDVIMVLIDIVNGICSNKTLFIKTELYQNVQHKLKQINRNLED